ncbi:MAG: hypothetical protein IAG13_04150 [Deltaproteobacteria bacterium]|nr:hypothetical protein [Nannocystaceae bacterium]
MRLRGCSLSLVCAALLACGGGDDGNSNADGSGSDSGGTEPSGTAPSSSVDDSSGEGMTGTPGDPECGNGVVEEFEECDDGEANSDSVPNACRVTCHSPRCGDGVLDDGPDFAEQCDDGPDNLNSEPNACRQSCVLPSCGDNVTDMGEACDDGNDAWDGVCFACDNLYYFVLNAPEGSAASIVRAARTGETIQLVGSDAGYDGVVQLALAADASSLFALQPSADRILAFDPADGALQSEIALDAAALGYDGAPHAMVRAADGLLYVVLGGMGSTRLVSVDQAGTTVTPVLDFGAELDVADATAQGSDAAVLVSTGNQVIRADLAAMTTSTAASGLTNAIGITYDAQTGRLWIAEHPGGVANITYSENGGPVTLFNPVAGYNDPQIRGLAIDVGMVVLATIRNADRVVSVQLLGGVGDFFTDMIAAPTDIEIARLSGT